MPSSELEEMQPAPAPEPQASEPQASEPQAPEPQVSEPQVSEPAPFVMDEFDAPAPAPAPASDQEAPPEEDKDGFRLLIFGGRHEDPARRAKREAKSLIDKAQAQVAAAAEEVAAAKEEAQEIRREAYEKGYQEGQKEGAQAMKARMEAAAGDLGRGLQTLEKARAEVLSGMEPEILALVQSICDRFFFTTQAVAPETMRNVVSRSLARVSEAEKIEVKLSPADLEIVKQYQPELEQGLNELKRLLIKADPELSPGDCLVFTPTAQVEATMAGRRKRIFSALEEALHGDQPLDLSVAIEPGAPGRSDDGPEQDQGASDELEDW